MHVPSLPEPRNSSTQGGEKGDVLDPRPQAWPIAPVHSSLDWEEHSADGGDALPPALTSSVSPLPLLQALRRNWLRAGLAGLFLAIMTGSLVWFLRPDKYTAFALLQIASVEPKILQDALRQETDNAKQYQRTQVELIKARHVIQAALKQDEIRKLALVQQQASPVDWLVKELKAELVENTDILRLSLSSRQHQGELAALVNALLDAYMIEIVKREQVSQLALLNDMEKIHASSQNKLRAQRESLRRLAETLKTGDSQVLTIKQKNLLEEYAALKRELSGLQARLRDCQVKLATSRLKPESGEGNPASLHAGVGTSMDTFIDREVEHDSLVQKQREAVLKAEEKLADIGRVSHTNTTPYLEAKHRLDTELLALKKVRDERRAGLAEQFHKSLEADRAAHSQLTQAEMKILEKQRDDLKGDLASLGREVDGIGIKSVDLELKRNEIDEAESVLRALRKEKERLQVELQATAKRRISVLTPAEEAAVLNPKARLLETLGGAFAALFLGLGIVSYREFRTRRLYTPAEVSHGLRLRIMGTLPALSFRRGALLSEQGDGEWNRIFFESIDFTRTLLMQGRPANGTFLLMVSSACSGEGKTTLASCLAASLARAQYRTLLIDCDLRNPCLHRLFSVRRTPGICEVLINTSSIEESVCPTPIAQLDLLPAGQYAMEAAAALAQGKLQSIYQQLRGRYDFLVVDSSPLLAVPDALMIGQGADGVVFSMQAGVSAAPHVYAAYERLREMGMPFIGVVLSGVRDKTLYSHNREYLVKAKQ